MTLGTRVEGVYSERYVSSRGEVGAFPVEGKRDDKKACHRKGVTDRNRLITLWGLVHPLMSINGTPTSKDSKQKCFQ